jgi:DnaJ-domain-containing protein 1
VVGVDSLENLLVKQMGFRQVKRHSICKTINVSARDKQQGVARQHRQQAKSHQLDSLMAKTGQAGK